MKQTSLNSGEEQFWARAAKTRKALYSNCWEDADVVLAALKMKKGGKYVSVSSAGDNTLSILSRGPALIVAVDINDAQIANLELRAAAFLRLPYESVLQFLGVTGGMDRREAYQHLRADLSPVSRKYWDDHAAAVQKGPIHSGRLEKYFALLRRFIWACIHTRKKTAELFLPKSEEERLRFYREQWNTARWKMMFRIFFDHPFMRLINPHPDPSWKQIYDRTERALSVLPVHENPYCAYILIGNFHPALPFYLRRENFDAIRENLGKLVIFRGDVTEALKANRGELFDGFNLSNIFEEMIYPRYVEELNTILDSCGNQARLVYWNQTADRRCPDILRNRICSRTEEAEELFAQNKSFFYKSLIIEECRSA